MNRVAAKQALKSSLGDVLSVVLGLAIALFVVVLTRPNPVQIDHFWDFAQVLLIASTTIAVPLRVVWQYYRLKDQDFYNDVKLGAVDFRELAERLTGEQRDIMMANHDGWFPHYWEGFNGQFHSLRRMGLTAPREPGTQTFTALGLALRQYLFNSENTDDRA